MDPLQALAAVVTTLTGEIVKLQERVDALEKNKQADLAAARAENAQRSEQYEKELAAIK